MPGTQCAEKSRSIFSTSVLLFLVVRPGATSSFLLLVATPFATILVCQNAKRSKRIQLEVPDLADLPDLPDFSEEEARLEKGVQKRKEFLARETPIT